MKHLTLYMLLLISASVTAQIEVEFGWDYKYNTIVKPSLDNIIGILNMSSTQFKNDVISKGYRPSKSEDDCNSFTKGSTAEKTIHEITKCSNYFFNISWFNKMPNKSSIGEFLEEIEPYNVGYDSESNAPVYQVRKGHVMYQIHISKKSTTEAIYCKKFNL